MTKFKKLLCVLLSAVMLMFLISGCGGKSTQTAFKAKKDNMKNIITGTGVLEAENQFEVNAQAMGDVLEAPFEEGQAIKKGDLLYVIDQTDLQSNIDKARLAIERAKLAYNQTADSINKLTIRSGISGTITNLYINRGDMVLPNGKIADVVNDDVMVLKVPFIDETTGGIYAGQSASVTIIGSFATVYGTVKKVTTGHMTSSGSVIKMVEINVPNPGTITKGDKGTAVIGTTACNDTGTFDYSSNETIYSEVSGKVESTNVSVGDHVSNGSVIAKLSNDTLTDQQQQNSVGIKDATLALKSLTDKLKDYNIRSTINGTAIKKTVDKGDVISAANGTKMAVIADLSKIMFKMKVDEIDVTKLNVGQKVTFTTEGSDKGYTGKIESISASGTLVNDVSLYEVKVAVDNPKGLMPCMNVEAKIKVK